MAKREDGKIVEIWDTGKKNLLGTYVYTAIPKPDTYVIDCADKKGNAFKLTKEINKADVVALTTQGFNTNVRNYVAGLARPTKPSKLKAYETFFAEKGIDVTGIDTEKLIAKLKDLTL